MTIIQYSNEGLTQTSRITKITYINETPIKTICVLQVSLSLFLTIPVWIRHDYSFDDIRNTIRKFDSNSLWKCASLFGIQPSRSSIKLSFSNPTSITFGSKSVVCKKLMKYIINNFHQFSNNQSVITDLNNGHVPPIPSHNLTLVEYNEIVQNLPEIPLNLLSVLHFRKCFQFKDISYVPLWIEANYIYCIRIITEVNYLKSRECRLKSGVGNRPVQIYIKNKLYYGLEESMYFTT